jgi:uncharacterized protein (TIGR02996 family)
MDEHEAFLKAIAAAPTEDGPRLVYADWLDERGDHDRAAFLRAEVALAAGTGPVDELRARFGELRAGLDPEWWPRVARVGPGVRFTFWCAACGLPLTGPLSPLADPVWLSKEDGTPLVPAGFYWQAAGDFSAGMEGHYCLNLADLRNTRPHPDHRRRRGCCGMDGCDGANTVCANGHAVGTECSDCWMPHYLHLGPAATVAGAGGLKR